MEEKELDEGKIQELIDKDINLIVPWYLLLSYGYYCLDESVVSNYFYGLY